MNLPINREFSAQENTLMNYLDESRRAIENKMRKPQAPSEHKHCEKMILAIDSAIAIAKKTNLNELTNES